MHAWMFLVPSVVVGFATILRTASGPFWLGRNIDPEYGYLMNSLSLTQGLSVGHPDHPGSTLHWAGAIWLYGINALLGKDDLITDVLTQPEFYLAHMHAVQLGILFLTLLIAGWLAFRWTGDPVTVLLLQLGIFVSFTARNSLSRMNPELLLLVFGVWLAITVLYHHFLIHQGEGKEPFWQYGLITGLGMGLKINFLLLWFLPLILLNGFRHRILYLGISGLVFFILTANPFMDFQGFLEFMSTQIIARQGYNRPLELGSNKIQAMIDGFSLFLPKIWQWEKPLLLLLLMFVARGLLTLLVKSHRKTDQTGSWSIRLWFGLLLILLGQMVLIANAPWSWLHYLCPVLGLTGLIAVVTWNWTDKPPKPKLNNISWGKTTYLAVFAFTIVWTLLKLPGELEAEKTVTKKWQESQQFKSDNHLFNEATINYWRASSIQYALDVGNSMARHHFSQQLSSLYSNYYGFNRWARKIYGHFGTKQETLDEVVSRTQKVLIHGQKWNPPLIPSLERLKFYKGGPGPLPFPKDPIIPTNNPQALSAEVIFLGSVEWIVLVTSQPQNSATKGNDSKYQP